MKETLSEPSAKKDLKRFGKRKATKKASAAKLAPKNFAMQTSRRNPTRRLTSVHPPNVVTDLIKDMAFLSLFFLLYLKRKTLTRTLQKKIKRQQKKHLDKKII